MDNGSGTLVQTWYLYAVPSLSSILQGGTPFEVPVSAFLRACILYCTTVFAVSDVYRYFEGFGIQPVCIAKYL